MPFFRPLPSTTAPTFKTLLLVFGAWVGFTAQTSAQPTATNAQAVERVNTAAAQRMLSQRIAKAYAQQVMNVMPTQATEVLRNSLQRFTANIASLRSDGLTPEAMRALGELDRISAPLIATASAPPTKEKLELVSKASDDTLAAAEALVKAMPTSNVTGASLIVLAGRQRMLSQRATSKFFLHQAGLRSPEVKTAYERTISDFELVLGEFRAQVDEFPEVRDEVELASVQMDFFKSAARSLEGVTDAQRATVARSSERLLETMDSLTKEMMTKFAARESSTAPAAAKKGR